MHKGSGGSGHDIHEDNDDEGCSFDSLDEIAGGRCIRIHDHSQLDRAQHHCTVAPSVVLIQKKKHVQCPCPMPTNSMIILPIGDSQSLFSILMCTTAHATHTTHGHTIE